MKSEANLLPEARQPPLGREWIQRDASLSGEIPVEGSRVRIDAVTGERDRPYVGVYGTLTQIDKAMGVYCVWLGLPFLHLVLATDVTVQS